MTTPPKTHRPTTTLLALAALALIAAGCGKSGDGKGGAPAADTLQAAGTAQNADTVRAVDSLQAADSVQAPDTVQTAAPEISYGTLIDKRDGRKYRTVEIGNLRWMADNLSIDAGKSWCYCEDTGNAKKYGRLYDWNTAMRACPAGWRLPDTADWNSLLSAAGGQRIQERIKDLYKYYWSKEAGIKLKWPKEAGIKLKSRTGWEDREDGHGKIHSSNGTDELGFAALPGGMRSSYIEFYEIGSAGYWWSATEDDSGKVYSKDIQNYSDVGEGSVDKSNALSVRCVEGGAPAKSKTRIPALTYPKDGKISQPAQTPQTAAATAKFVPAGYRLTKEISGDLNNDGAADRVLIIKNMNFDCGDYGYYDNNYSCRCYYVGELGIIIAFKTGDGYERVLENRVFFAIERHLSGTYIPPGEDALEVSIKRGSLFIEYDYNGGGMTMVGKSYNFRYQNSDFELIGFDQTYYYMRFDFESVSLNSVNLLSKRILTREKPERCRSPNGSYEDRYGCENAPNKETWEDFIIERPISLKDIHNIVEFNVYNKLLVLPADNHHGR